MKLSESQRLLLNQIKHHGSMSVMTGRYKTSLQTLKSLVRKGLVILDRPIGIGHTTFIATFVNSKDNPGSRVFIYTQKIGEPNKRKQYGEIYKTYKRYPSLVLLDSGETVSVMPESIYLSETNEL